MDPSSAHVCGRPACGQELPGSSVSRPRSGWGGGGASSLPSGPDLGSLATLLQAPGPRTPRAPLGHRPPLASRLTVTGRGEEKASDSWSPCWRNGTEGGHPPADTRGRPGGPASSCQLATGSVKSWCEWSGFTSQSVSVTLVTCPKAVDVAGAKKTGSWL